MNKHQKQPLVSPEKYIRTRARTLPVGACYINDNWKESGFAAILVTRIHINGHVTHGAYMVDLLCLGVKDSFWNFNQNPLDFNELLDKHQQSYESGIRIRQVDYALVHNIIHGAIAFAEEFGFHPHKSFELTKHILEEDADRIALIDLEFGHKGKPLYISNPENPGEKARVLAHLKKHPGEGNYNFITEAEADDFFEREYEEDEEAKNYHDPEVKRNIILDFLTAIGKPKKILKGEMGTLGKVLENGDIIYFNYMDTEDELEQAAEEVANLFKFSITGENLSNEILYGKTAPPANSKEIRREAERVYRMVNDKKYTAGEPEAKRLMERYPEIPVFQYFYMRFLEMKTGLSTLLPAYRELSTAHPDYIPFVYMFAMSSLLNKKDDVELPMDTSLHLKNFCPERTSFCREETLLYIHLLTLQFSAWGELAQLEELLNYLQDRHPELLTEEQILTTKVAKLPDVAEWCTNWLKENPE